MASPLVAVPHVVPQPLATVPRALPTRRKSCEVASTLTKALVDIQRKPITLHIYGIFRTNGIFWNDDKKSRNLTSGVRFSESARSIFSLRVQNERTIEKEWNFDKKCF